MAQTQEADSQRVDALAEKLTGKILTQMKGMLDSEDMPELTNEEQKIIYKELQEHAGLFPGNTPKKDLFIAHLQQITSPMLQEKETPAVPLQFKVFNLARRMMEL